MKDLPTLVQPEETNSGWDTPNTYRDLLEHEHAAELSSARRLYDVVDLQADSNKLEVLDSCRTSSWFIRHTLSGEVRIASNCCKLRWCPMCAKSRQNFITRQVSSWFLHAKSPKLLTVTLRHTSAPLKSQVDFLYKCFQKFRKRKLLTDNIAGGVWFFQVKKSSDGNTWHPHVHCLIDSNFIPHKELMALWSEITGGSIVVDIRQIINTEKAVKHNARYCAKPCSLVDLTILELLELFEAFNKRRLVGCFGSAKDIQLRPVRPPDSDQWENIGSWSYVIGLAGEDDRANQILLAWRTQKPLREGITLCTLEHTGTDPPPPEVRPLVHQQYVLDFYAR